MSSGIDARKDPGPRSEIQAGRVRLVPTFRARLWSVPHDPQALGALTYRKLIDVAEGANAEVEADLCLA